MAKGVFTTRISPSYKDIPEEQYHFPRTYLNQVRETVGDLIVYYEPGRTGEGNARSGRQVYFAVARVKAIREDPELGDHYYAEIDSYLNFDTAVPFRDGGGFYESSLSRDGGQMNRSAFRRAVRLLQEHEFEAILAAGFESLASVTGELVSLAGVEEEQEDLRRPIVEQVVRRPFREAKFSAQVRSAYHATCALTGLRIINGGGRPEVDAAHIKPVGDGHNGPDSIRNGLALSKTMHWMFDRGLIAITDDYRIIAAERLIPDPALRILNANGRVLLPDSPVERPHPAFLRYHREHIYKG